MSIISEILEEQFLTEITLQMYFDRYVDHNKISLEQFNILSTFDPTTRNGQRGKYLEWLVNMVKKFDLTVEHDRLENDTYMLYSASIQNYLKKFDELSTGVSITEFKNFDDFIDYTRDLKPKVSNKEKKKLEKNIFNMPDDIKVIDTNDTWICIETLTREGNIKGAQYKTSPQANWCTAYLDTDSHWTQYHIAGDLLQFINKKDPYEKYQIFIKDGKVQESRDYDDSVDNTPIKDIIPTLPNFEDNYGSINEREPLKFVFDEEATAHRFLDDDWENEEYYLNRYREEDEYEEYNIPEEYQINHWERVINEGFDIFERKDNRNTRWATASSFDDWANDKMPNFIDLFVDPFFASEEDKPAVKASAKEAVYDDLYYKFEEKWEDWVRMESPTEPDEQSFTRTEDYHTAFKNWVKEDKKDFFDENATLYHYIEWFLEEFPHEFKFELHLPDSLTYMKDNESEQLKFNFEKKNIFSKLLEGAFSGEDETPIKDKEIEIDDEEAEPIPNEDESETDEPELDSNHIIERPDKKTARLLSFDKVSINTELKEIIQKPLPEFPLDRIKEILNKCSITLANENYALPDDNGDVDLELATTDGRVITNSVMVLYYSKIEGSDTFNFSCYLT